MPRRSAAKDQDYAPEQDLLPPLRVDSPRTGEREETWHDPLALAPGVVEGGKHHDNTPVPYNEHRVRYHQYLENLSLHAGDRVKALAATYGITEEEAAVRAHELHADVMRGISGSPISKLLEEQDLGKHARAMLLAKHAWSGVPAASLAAIKVAGDLDGDKHDAGARYEQHLRDVLADD